MKTAMQEAQRSKEVDISVNNGRAPTTGDATRSVHYRFYNPMQLAIDTFQQFNEHSIKLFRHS